MKKVQYLNKCIGFHNESFKFLYKKSLIRESNPGPFAYEANALPTKLNRLPIIHIWIYLFVIVFLKRKNYMIIKITLFLSFLTSYYKNC